VANHDDTWLPPWQAPVVDRMTERRQDEAWLAAQLEGERARLIPVWQSQVLLGARAEPVWLHAQDVRDWIGEANSTVFLGEKEGLVYFVLDVPYEGGAPPASLARLGRFRDLRRSVPLLDEWDLGLLAYAKAMVYWHQQHCFCGSCGSPTVSASGGHLRLCTNAQCRQQHFPRTDPAVIVLVWRDERCLLGRKAEWPAGRYSTLAGFVEPGESLEAAVARELREEVGVELKSGRYFGSQPWPFPTSLMVGFTAQAAGEAIVVDRSELEDARWFTRQELRVGLEQGTLSLPPRAAISYRLITNWLDTEGGRDVHENGPVL
jgi:NAD+ diphosphatase